MNTLSVHTRQGVPPTVVTDTSQLKRVLTQADQDARAASRPNIIDLKAPNGDTLSMVVGSDETVLGFTAGSGQPPFYASSGPVKDAQPVMTCYLYSTQRTEFPRHA